MTQADTVLGVGWRQLHCAIGNESHRVNAGFLHYGNLVQFVKDVFPEAVWLLLCHCSVAGDAVPATHAR